MSTVDLAPFNAVLQRLEQVADRLERSADGSGSGTGGGAPISAAAAVANDPPVVVAYDAFMKAKLAPMKDAAAELAVENITEATEDFCQACEMLRGVFVASAKCRKPEPPEWQKILQPVMELGTKANKACDNRSDYFQDRKAVAEALNIVMLATSTSPPMHLQNVLESMDFHAIKVMQKKNAKETEWIKALKELLKDFKEWCTENCKLGLDWKFQGQDPVEYFDAQPLGSAPAATAAKGGKGKGKAPPPPPKGAGPPKMNLEPVKAAAGGGGMAAVFSAINNFSTSGLKKVTDDMKTKNRPKEEGSSIVKAGADSGATKAAAAPKARAGKGPKGPPILELQKGTNWMVENHEGVNNLKLDEGVTMGHLVCIINCKNTTVYITPKVKSISIDGCERVNVVCGDVVSVVELVNSDRCQVQTTGVVHSFAIDKCNGVNLWLGHFSLDAEIVTSKSSEMNITVPEEGGEEGDTIEIPIPEQFVTKLTENRKKLKTEVSSLYS